MTNNKPTHCDMAMSSQCMLQCRMCNLWQNNAAMNSRDWLSVEEYKDLFCQLKDFIDAPFLISFCGGGEPLLRDNMLDIAKIGTDAGFKIYFPTNAYLIDKEMSKRLADSGIFSIGISLDSMSKEVHDFLRGKEGCWDRVMQAIEHLQKNCPNIFITILAIIMESNLDEVINLATWVCTHPGLQGVFFQAIQKPFNTPCPDNWYEVENYRNLWPNNLSRLNSVINDLLALKKSGVNGFKISNTLPQLELFKSYFGNPHQFAKKGRCHLDKVMRIDYIGNIIMCDAMGIIGNIRERPIKQIWLSAKADAIRNLIHDCNKSCHHLVNCYHGEESN